LDDNDISCGQFFRKLKTVLFEQAMVKGLLENAGLKRMLNMVYIVTLQIFLVFSGEFKLIHILQVLKITYTNTKQDYVNVTHSLDRCQHDRQ